MESVHQHKRNFKTLSLDRVSPITFIDVYIKAKIDHSYKE